MAAASALLIVNGGTALAQSSAYVQGVELSASASGDGTVSTYANGGSAVHLSAHSVAPIGDWGVSVSETGTFRDQPFTSYQQADLATGTLRQRLEFSGGNFYQLSSYGYMSDYLSFHGSGTAQISARLTGAFTGAPNSSFEDYYLFSVTAYGMTMTPGGLDYSGTDITGSFSLSNRNAGNATLGDNCGSSWALGTVSCQLTSTETGAIDVTMFLNLNVGDGDTINVVVNTQAGVYDLSAGGVDFGHTARLGVTTSPGLTWDSNAGSGVFLAAALPPVPEPSTYGLMLIGLGVVGWFVRRRPSTSMTAMR